MQTEIVKRSEFESFFEIETRWKDMDALGHINNATFLTYLESGRIELVKKWDFKKHAYVRYKEDKREMAKRQLQFHSGSGLLLIEVNNARAAELFHVRVSFRKHDRR